MAFLWSNFLTCFERERTKYLFRSKYGQSKTLKRVTKHNSRGLRSKPN